MRTIVALALGGALLSTACGNAASPAPSDGASAVATPASTPVESASAAAATDAEARVLANVRSDIESTCAPLRTDLPPSAVAAITCTPESDVAASVTVSMFASQKALLAAYKAWLKAQGIETRSHQGSCLARKASEGAYTPGDDGAKLIPHRSACYVDGDGKAHYVATVPKVGLIEVVGKGGKIPALEDWAWLGNQDQPGGPTVWGANGPIVMEG
jgi:hypothetical protein